MENSLGRAPLGRSQTEATTGWTEGKEATTGWTEGKRPEKLCAQDFSSGLQMLGDGTCIASLAGSDAKNAQLLARVFQDDCSEKCAPKTCQSFQSLGHGTCIASLARSETKRAELLARIFQDKFHQRDCPEKLVLKTSQMVSKQWGKGACRTCMGKSSLLEGFSFCSAFCPSMLGFRSLCSEAN